MCKIKELLPNIEYSAKIYLPPENIPMNSKGCMLLLLGPNYRASQEEKIIKGDKEFLRSAVLQMNKRFGFPGVNGNA